MASKDSSALSPRARSTREKLLASGMEALASDGYSARLSDIVEGAGVTTGAFYRYFEGKSALYGTLFERYGTVLESMLKGAPDLKSALVSWLAVSREYRGVTTAAAELVRRDKQAQTASRELRQTCARLLRKVAQPELELSPAATLLFTDVTDQYVLMEARGWIPERDPATVVSQLMLLSKHGLYRR